MSWQVSFGNRDTPISVFVFFYCSTRGSFSRLFKSLFFRSRLNWTSRGSSEFWKTGVFSSLYWLPHLATLIWVIWAGNWHIYRHLEQLHLITRIKLGGTPGLLSVYFLRPARFEPGGRWGHLPVMPLLRWCGGSIVIQVFSNFKCMLKIHSCTYICYFEEIRSKIGIRTAELWGLIPRLFHQEIVGLDVKVCCLLLWCTL